MFKKLCLLTAYIILSLNLMNCSGSDASFSTKAEESGADSGLGDSTNTLGDSSSDDGASCATELQTLTIPIKLLFVVDTSGSNYGDFIDPGTDPNKELRGNSIQAFFNKYGSSSNFSWGFITFNGFNTESLIGSSYSPEFTNSASTMQNAINEFYQIYDEGTTPYRAALDVAIKAIENDSGYSSDTKYVVVFISDGVPEPEVSSSVLKRDIEDLLSIHSDQISFNTIYYGEVSYEASQRLSNMAYWGGGQFLDVSYSANKTFSISDHITIPGVSCSE